MLTPAQVIPFLSHDDPEVRSKARAYLSSAHDPAPATAEDFWAAADKVPPEETGWYVDRVGLLPQTENSLRRLLDELPNADPATRDSLRRALERVEFDLLRQHWDTVRSAEGVDDGLREHLQARFDLANEPPEPLWDRMMTFARELGESLEITESQELQVDRLIEAVSRHPDVFRERVMAALGDSSVKDWAELIVTDIAGQMRLGDAIGLLLEKLNLLDAELLWDVAADALVHIGSEQVVERIAQRFRQHGVGFQISAAEVLGRIKRPQSQAALVQLLQSESDLGIVSSIVTALVRLLPDDGETLATLRAIARENGYDRTTTHLDEELLTLATMTGLDLPEASEWRQKIEENRSRWAAGMRDVDHLMQSPGMLGPSTMHAAPLVPAARVPRSAAAVVAQQPQAARRPFRNASVKVGRNDPCPCGSGKKHKKCCGK